MSGVFVGACRVLLRRPLRSALTIFGIQIGVCTVACITTAGVVARTRVMAEVSGFGANMLVLRPEARAGVHGGRAGRLTEDDGRALARDIASVAAVAPAVTALVQVSGPRGQRLVKYTGTTLDYLPIARWTVSDGEAWSERDQLLRARLCVIGATVQASLFKSTDPIGQYLRLGSQFLRVSGVLEAKGSDLLGNEQDDVVLVPIETYRTTVGGSDSDSVGALLVAATAPSVVERAATQIRSLVHDRHGLGPAETDDFVVNTQKETAALYQRILAGLTLVVVALASISLVVGGVGIMNIMLVSVTERTREVGIHLALGSSPLRIRMQFLTEATILSTLGGLLGLISAGALVWVARRNMPELPIYFSSQVFLCSLFASVATGIAFGYLPAHRASKLDPAVALGRG